MDLDLPCFSVHWLQVEVGRTPSMQCHTEKVADVCSTEYKDTTVGELFSATNNVSPEKVERCKPVERLESERVCQNVPHRVCRQVKHPLHAVVQSTSPTLQLIDSH